MAGCKRAGFGGGHKIVRLRSLGLAWWKRCLRRRPYIPNMEQPTSNGKGGVRILTLFLIFLPVPRRRSGRGPGRGRSCLAKPARARAKRASPPPPPPPFHGGEGVRSLRVQEQCQAAHCLPPFHSSG